MSTTNWKRVVVGGIAAGIVFIVIDVVCFGFAFNQMVESAYTALGRSFEEGGALQPVFLLSNALTEGLVGVWLYAAIRPNYGAGPRTAAIAGVAVWLLTYVVNGLGLAYSLFPASLVVASIAVGLVESLVAIIIGAYFYRE